jgi:hypothetical protein
VAEVKPHQMRAYIHGWRLYFRATTPEAVAALAELFGARRWLRDEARVPYLDTGVRVSSRTPVFDDEPEEEVEDYRRAVICVPRGSYEEMRAALLRQVLAEEGSIRKAASALEVPRSTLGAWMQKIPAWSPIAASMAAMRRPMAMLTEREALLLEVEREITERVPMWRDFFKTPVEVIAAMAKTKDTLADEVERLARVTSAAEAERAKWEQRAREAERRLEMGQGIRVLPANDARNSGATDKVEIIFDGTKDGAHERLLVSVLGGEVHFDDGDRRRISAKLRILAGLGHAARSLGAAETDEELAALAEGNLSLAGQINAELRAKVEALEAEKFAAVVVRRGVAERRDALERWIAEYFALDIARVRASGIGRLRALVPASPWAGQRELEGEPPPLTDGQPVDLDDADQRRAALRVGELLEVAEALDGELDEGAVSEVVATKTAKLGREVADLVERVGWAKGGES